MKLIDCVKCGSNDLLEEDGFIVCAYCRIKFVPNAASSISVYEDVQKLLAKCRDEPQNRRRFANLILDLDPTNTEALRYLR